MAKKSTTKSARALTSKDNGAVSVQGDHAPLVNGTHKELESLSPSTNGVSVGKKRSHRDDQVENPAKVARTQIENLQKRQEEMLATAMGSDHLDGCSDSLATDTPASAISPEMPTPCTNGRSLSSSSTSAANLSTSAALPASADDSSNCDNSVLPNDHVDQVSPGCSNGISGRSSDLDNNGSTTDIPKEPRAENVEGDSASEAVPHGTESSHGGGPTEGNEAPAVVRDSAKTPDDLSSVDEEALIGRSTCGDDLDDVDFSLLEDASQDGANALDKKIPNSEKSSGSGDAEEGPLIHQPQDADASCPPQEDHGSCENIPQDNAGDVGPQPKDGPSDSPCGPDASISEEPCAENSDEKAEVMAADSGPEPSGPVESKVENNSCDSNSLDGEHPKEDASQPKQEQDVKERTLPCQEETPGTSSVDALHVVHKAIEDRSAKTEVDVKDSKLGESDKKRSSDLGEEDLKAKKCRLDAVIGRLGAQGEENDHHSSTHKTEDNRVIAIKPQVGFTNNEHLSRPGVVL